ncbi:CRISPR type III-B/RAMP module-associated protein Cmr5 [Marinactinospora thermotolerans DSM 45154]|uniref:CRISPR type III-B/RAMP module-associated protein Cmr5 n=1 Tax=Marinactinospora thermotolerans DSM 45154 TaxID=1122192 RepID=A0A1T4S4H2_9ACTN|nr:type III-B CRISPR module-associated protein Cmr5 [Marinactinospora thermotolerans]SKA23189.1 CRISPR type III-B/RAMP module-associated protein Cmr5 [Marinactinospora thermotolerans DSM 45154]
MRRIDQGMARDAADLLPRVTGDNAKELRSRFRHLPIQLHSSGLAATYAFLAARSSSASTDRLADAYRDVAKQIRTQLAAKGLISDELTTESEPEVHRAMLTALGDMDWTAYARASREVGILFSWLRRLADAVYSGAETRSGRSGTGEDR